MKNQGGFTLIEVMIAIGIIALGMSAILVAENNSLDTSLRAKRMTTVAMLARNALIEAEREYEGKTFEESREEASGTFEAPFQEYRWIRKVKKVEFPNLMNTKKEGAQGGTEDPGIARVVKLATQHLSKASREVNIRILWKEKGKEQEFGLSQYWVDLNHPFNLNEQL